MARPLTDEEKEYLQGAAEVGPRPRTDEEQAYIDNTPPPATPDATLGQNVRHALGGAVIAGTDVLDMPYNISQGRDALSEWIPAGVRKTARALAPTTAAAFDLFKMGADREGAVSEKPGLKQAKEALAPEFENVHPTAEYARTALEWGAGGVPKLFSKGVKNLPKMIPHATPDAVMGTAAATGQVAGEYLSPDGAGSETGELVGGLLGVAAALKAGKVEGLTPTQRKMLERLKTQFDNPDEAVAAIEARLAKGEIGTLTDLSRDRNIANVESMLDNTPAGGQALPKTLDARVGQIYDETMEPFQTGAHAEHGPRAAEVQINREVNQILADSATDTAAASERASGLSQAVDAEAKRLQGAATTARTQADEATTAFDDALDATDPGRTTVEISESGTSNLNRAERATKVRSEQRAWAKFDGGPKVDTIPMREAMDEVLLELSPKARKDLLREFPALKNVVGRWPQKVLPQDITDVIQDFKSAISAADAAGSSSRHTVRIGKMVDRMEDALSKANNDYAAGVAATKDRYDRFGGRVGRAKAGDEPELTFATLGTKGDQGAATVRQIAEARVPTASRDLYDFVLAEATRKGENITPEFLAQYQGAINRMPEADRLKLQNLVDGKQTRESALKQATQVEATAETGTKAAAAEQSRLAKSLDAELKAKEAKTGALVESLRTDVRAQYSKGFEEADALVDDLLTKPSGPEQLKLLMDDLTDMDAGNDTLNTVASLKTKIGDRMDAQLFDLFTATGKESKTPAVDALKKFRNMRRRLVDSGVLDDATAGYLDEVLERTQSELLRKQASARVAAGVEGSNGERNRLFASILSAITIGPLPGAYNLQLGGAVRRNFYSMLEVEPTRKNINALVEYMTDPEAFLAGLDALKTPEAKTRHFLTRLVGAGQAAEIMAGEE